MYTLSQIRRRVDALKRKYATELTVVKLYPLAEEFSLLWTCAVADGNPVPDTHAFIRSIARRGLRLNTLTLLVHYLERCRNEEREPDSLGIISILLPQMEYQRLRDMLRWMTPILDERAAQTRSSESTAAPARRPCTLVDFRPYWAAITWLATRCRAAPRCVKRRPRPLPQGNPNLIRANPVIPDLIRNPGAGAERPSLVG